MSHHDIAYPRNGYKSSVCVLALSAPIVKGSKFC